MPPKPQLVPQHLGQQPGVGAGGHAVDVRVGVHHRAGAGGDRGLERRQDHVEQLAPAHRDRAVVAGGPGGRVAGEVLERGQHARALQPADVRGAEHRDQVRVLAHGLLDPAPAVVADHVEHGGQALVHAERGHVPADRGGHPLDQLGVEGGAPGDRGRVDGRAVRGEPGQALLVHQRRDAEPGPLDHHPLLADQLGRALGRGDRHAAVHPGEVAEPVLAGVGQAARRPGREHVLHRGDVEGAVLDGHLLDPDVGTDPAAAELGDLLLEGHLGEQQLDPLGRRARGVLPRPGALCGAGAVRCRHESPRLLGGYSIFRKVSPVLCSPPAHHGTVCGLPSPIVFETRRACERALFTLRKRLLKTLDTAAARSYVNSCDRRSKDQSSSCGGASGSPRGRSLPHLR